MNHQEIAELLRSQRESLGLSQADVAVMLDGDRGGKKMQTHVSRIERGYTNTSIRSLLEYAAVVGLQFTIVRDPAGPKPPPHRVKLHEYTNRVTKETRFRSICKTKGCPWKSEGDESKYAAMKAGHQHKRETANRLWTPEEPCE